MCSCLADRSPFCTIETVVKGLDVLLKARLVSCQKQLSKDFTPKVCPRAMLAMAHSQCAAWVSSYWNCRNDGCLRLIVGWVGSKIVIAQLNLNGFWILKHHWKAGSETRDRLLFDFGISGPLEKYLVRSSPVKS